MKKIIFLVGVFVMAFHFQLLAQQEVVYGTVRTDGYQKITKGAFWSKRPEAKLVYEGSYPSGYRVFLLEEDYYVRFVDGEHNNFDRNYIVFPKGEKIYTDSIGVFYSAKCGNKIEYIRPVNMVKVVEVEKKVFVKEPNTPISTVNTYNYTNNNYYLPEEQPYRGGRHRGSPRIKPIVYIVGIPVVIGVGYLLYSLINKANKPEPIWVPGGAPKDE